MSDILFSVLISGPSDFWTVNPQTISSQALATDWLLFNPGSVAAVRQRDCMPKSGFVEQGYELSINRYKEVVHEEVEHRKPQEILNELENIEKEIMQGMKQLRGMLK